MKNAREMLRSRAYAFICERMMSGELVPGQKLSEQKLADACGISRTPIHGAILRLIEEGMLYQLEKSGTYVTKFTRADILSAYDIREAIETHEIARVVPTLTDREKQNLKRECQSMHDSLVALRKSEGQTSDLESAFLKHDMAFHRIFLDAAKNPLATKVVLAAYQRNRFFGLLRHQHTFRNIAWAWYHHEKIARAVCRGDVEDAVRWMRAHIRRSRSDALARFTQASRRDKNKN